MKRLIDAYFERDLTPAEEARLHRLLQRSEAASMEFSRRAEKHYASLGLTAAALLLAQGGASQIAAPAGGWMAKLLGGVKALTLKSALGYTVAAAVVGGGSLTVLKLLPERAPEAEVSEAAAVQQAGPNAQLVPPQVGDGLAITLELGTAKLLSVSIFDAKGGLVRHFEPQRYEAGVQRLLWNGLDDQQEPVPAGRYRVMVDLGTSSLERWLEVR